MNERFILNKGISIILFSLFLSGCLASVGIKETHVPDKTKSVVFFRFQLRVEKISDTRQNVNIDWDISGKKALPPYYWVVGKFSEKAYKNTMDILIKDASDNRYRAKITGNKGYIGLELPIGHYQIYGVQYVILDYSKRYLVNSGNVNEITMLPVPVKFEINQSGQPFYISNVIMEIESIRHFLGYKTVKRGNRYTSVAQYRWKDRIKNVTLKKFGGNEINQVKRLFPKVQ